MSPGPGGLNRQGDGVAIACNSFVEEISVESRAKLFGHPVHQMLIVLPLGLLATALAFDAS